MPSPSRDNCRSSPKVKPVDHLHNEARQMLLRKPFVHGGRQQKPSLADQSNGSCSSEGGPRHARINSAILTHIVIVPPIKSDRLLEHLTKRLNRLWLHIDGTNQFQHPHWYKGASHEWQSLIPTIWANVSLLRSKPAIPVRKFAELYNMALSTVGDSSSVSAKRAVSDQTSLAGTRLSRLKTIQLGLRNSWPEQPDSTLAELQVRLAKKT